MKPLNLWPIQLEVTFVAEQLHFKIAWLNNWKWEG